MKVTTYIAQFLKNKGVDTVFELQGGMITRILHELNKQGGFNIISVHHEQAAAFAADAYGRITHKPGIALATSGPGATNLITGIGSCYFDSVPAIFITGQVNLSEQKGELNTRQLGFQETDIVSIIRPITKKAFAVKRPNEVQDILEESWRISMEGRPGPVLIDIPMNIQNENIESVKNIHGLPETLIESSEIKIFVNEFNTSLEKSLKPLIL